MIGGLVKGTSISVISEEFQVVRRVRTRLHPDFGHDLDVYVPPLSLGDFKLPANTRVMEDRHEQ